MRSDTKLSMHRKPQIIYQWIGLNIERNKHVSDSGNSAAATVFIEKGPGYPRKAGAEFPVPQLA